MYNQRRLKQLKMMRQPTFISWPMIFLLIGKICQAKDYEVIADLTSSVGDLRRIWDNTGLSPPGPGVNSVNYLTSKDNLVNLALMGSLPFKAISHVRIHWLLDLIQVREKNFPLFDFHLLDELMFWLRSFRMRPSLELMGNPGQLFSDLSSNPNTVVAWQSFITDLAGHLVSKYGEEEVSKWRFELWNEPDSKQYNILNLTASSYLKYATACMKGLAMHGMTLSGPADTFRDWNHHKLSWGFLQFCSAMTSLTGSCCVETITFHKKGEGVAENVVKSSSEFYSKVVSLYPPLQKCSFANNEADILSGWWREEDWRGDVTYGSYVCEVIMLSLNKIKMEKLALSYISNDNGFMNEPPAYFNQRTLLTRFKANSSEDSTSQFVRKPVMVTMAMLSYLGPKELPIFLRHSENSSCDSKLSVLAGGDGTDVGSGWSAAVVLSLGPGDATHCSNNKLELRLRLPLDIELKYIVYQLDNEQTNPRKVWEEGGKPNNPSDELLEEMRVHEGPAITQTGSVSGEWLTLNLPIRSPSVTLVHLCTNPRKPPAKVLNLRSLNITFNEVMLLWQDSDTRCVKTYEVYFCRGPCLSGDFKMISDRINIMLSYQFKAQSDPKFPEGSVGKYKVRVRDYWDQVSEFSDVLNYG